MVKSKKPSNKVKAPLRTVKLENGMLNINSFRDSKNIQLKQISGINFNSTKYFLNLVGAGVVALFILFFALAIENISVSVFCIIPFAFAYDKAKIRVKTVGYPDILITGEYRKIKKFYEKLRSEIQNYQN